MPLTQDELDGIGQAVKEVIDDQLGPIKERLDALESGAAGKNGNGDVEALEAQVTEMKSALDQTLGASKSLVDDDGNPIAEKSQPTRDAWGRRINR